MSNIQNEIYAIMSKNLKTSKEYAGMYMETVYGYSNVVSKKAEKNIIPTEEIAKSIDTKKVIEKSNEIAKETHMAGNPIYNFEYVKGHKKDIYNRSKVKKETQRKVESYLEDEDVNTF